VRGSGLRPRGQRGPAAYFKRVRRRQRARAHRGARRRPRSLSRAGHSSRTVNVPRRISQVPEPAEPPLVRPARQSRGILVSRHPSRGGSAGLQSAFTRRRINESAYRASGRQGDPRSWPTLTSPKPCWCSNAGENCPARAASAECVGFWTRPRWAFAKHRRAPRPGRRR